MGLTYCQIVQVGEVAAISKSLEVIEKLRSISTLWSMFLTLALALADDVAASKGNISGKD